VSAPPPLQLLTFRLGTDDYGVDIAAVVEICAVGSITRVPGMPPFVRGATNLRGRAIPVIDLALKFGLPETVVTRWTCFLLVRVPVGGSETCLALLVDEMKRLVEDGSSRLTPAPPVGTHVHPDYLLGLLPPEATGESDRFVLVLDVAKVLAEEELLLARSAADPGEDTSGSRAIT
jgi:purine-binding chemotaxis protein CheW